MLGDVPARTSNSSEGAIGTLSRLEPWNHLSQTPKVSISSFLRCNARRSGRECQMIWQKFLVEPNAS